MHLRDVSCSAYTLSPSTLFDVMLTMFVCATRWLSMHLYTLAHMSMLESCLLVCRPCFNTMKLWTFDPNLHLSLSNTTFCLLSCLIGFLLVCLLASLFVCLLVCLLSLFACLLVCLPSSLFAYLVACHVSYHMLCLLRLYASLLCTHCALSMHLFLSLFVC